MISNFITLSNKKGETGGAETVHLSASSEYTPIIQRVSCCSGLWIIVCPLSFFVLSLHCLSFFDLMLPFRPIFAGRLCAIINFQLSGVSLMVYLFIIVLLDHARLQFTVSNYFYVIFIRLASYALNLISKFLLLSLDR